VGTGVLLPIARVEAEDPAASLHHARGIPAKHTRRACRRRPAAPDFYVRRIDGHAPDLDQQVMIGRALTAIGFSAV